jgi:hypothetical protein
VSSRSGTVIISIISNDQKPGAVSNKCSSSTGPKLSKVALQAWGARMEVTITSPQRMEVKILEQVKTEERVQLQINPGTKIYCQKYCNNFRNENRKAKKYREKKMKIKIKRKTI